MRRTRLGEGEAETLKKWVVECPHCSYDDFCDANPTIHISRATYIRYSGKKKRPYYKNKIKTNPTITLYQTIGILPNSSSNWEDLLKIINDSCNLNLQSIALADGSTEIRRTQN